MELGEVVANLPASTPGWKDNHDESLYIRRSVAPSETVAEALDCQLSVDVKDSRNTLKDGQFRSLYTQCIDKLCARNTTSGGTTTSMDAVHTTNVEGSQTISNESLRLDVTQKYHLFETRPQS
nr:hypothetical protein [Tanacetum cinerariifolium]